MTCQTLSDVFKAHGMTRVDFMSLDVEGAELACLEGIDWSVVSIDTILDNSFQKVAELLTSRGYVNATQLHRDVFFVHRSMTGLLQKVEVWNREVCPRINEALRPGMIRYYSSPHTETNDHEAPLAPLAAAALLRLTERGCAKAQASSSTLHEDLLALLKELLSPQTLDLLHPLGAKEGGAGASAGSALPPKRDGELSACRVLGPKPELSREVSFAATSKVVVTATGVSADFEMLQQPYGDRLPEGCLDRFESLLGQLELRKEALAPQTSAACAAARGALAAGSTQTRYSGIRAL
eukprot:s49_g13.t1